MSTSNQCDDSASGPPTKRSCNDLESPRTGIQKHGSLYFENGNIVLLSLPEDAVITAFKVYRDFLALHSPVFEGMLSIPSTPNAEEYDGVPLVNLHDKAAHLFPFLKALYEPMTFPMKRDFYFSFNIVESTFMLAKKYQCDKLLKWMSTTFSDIWPKDVTVWDDSRTYSRDTPSGNLLDISRLPEPCSAIRLAREYDVSSILPAAFYHLHYLSLRALDHKQCPRGDYMGLAFDTSPKFTYLSSDDFTCLLRGNIRLQKFMQIIIDLLPGTCTTTNCERIGWAKKFGCARKFDLEVKSLKDHRERVYFDELCILAIQLQRFHAQGDLCRVCRAKYIGFLKDQRSRLWSSLPVFFGLRTDTQVSDTSQTS